MNSLSEKDMEDAISENPDKFLEAGLRLVARQYPIGSYYFDLIFENEKGTTIICEIQKGKLDRNHTYKILDYYHEYKDKFPNKKVALLVIANKIPKERKKRLKNLGIYYKELPEDIFLKNIKNDTSITKKLESKSNSEMAEFLLKKSNTSTDQFNRQIVIEEDKYTLQSRFRLKSSSPSTINLFKLFHKELSRMSIEMTLDIWSRTHDRGVTYFGSRAFLFCNFAQHYLSLTFRTDGTPISGVEPSNWLHGNDCIGGRYNIHNEKDIYIAVEAAKKCCEIRK